MLNSGENWLEDLDPDSVREVQKDPAAAESLKSICEELYNLVSRLVDEKDPVKAFAVMVIVARTLRIALTRKRPKILAVIEELKKRTDFRPILGKRDATDT